MAAIVKLKPQHQEAAQISVVIPSLNEAERIAYLLERLRATPEIGEIVVCDGGSVDATAQIAARFDARVLVCKPNRGAQMNVGARATHNDILWFLHADALPPKSGARRIVEACGQVTRVLDARRKPVLGGNFRLQFDEQRPASRLFSLIARVLRSGGVYYGDSGIWVRREVFDELGGFAEWPLFEDYDFARRLEQIVRRRNCTTFCIAPPIVVSSRRFGKDAKSSAQLLCRWAKLQVLFGLGIKPEVLAKMYRR